MAKAAVGTVLKIATVAVAQLTSIGGLDLSAETIDVTTLDSTGGWREFIAGFKDGGEVVISGYLNPSDSGQEDIYDAYDSGDVTAFTIEFPSTIGATWQFNAVVTKYSTGAEVDGAVTFESSFKVSGKPTLARTASAGLSNLAMSGTGGTLTPAFDNGVYYYAYTGVTATSVTVTATTAGAQTIKLYVDGAYLEALTSASASSAIAIAAGKTKKLTIVANEAAKTAKTYEIIVEAPSGE